MGLQKKVLPMSLAKGLATGQDPMLPSEGMLEVENGVYNRQGAIDKRTGIEDVGIASHPDDLNMAEFQDKAVLLGESVQVYKDVSSGYSEAADLELYDIQVDPVPMGQYTSRVPGDQVIQVVELAAVRAISMQNSTSLTWTLLTQDTDTGLIIDELEMTNVLSGAVLLASNNGVLQYFYVATGNLLKMNSITAAGNINAPATLVTTRAPTGYLCLDIVAPTAFMVAFRDTTNQCHVIVVNNAGAIAASYNHNHNERPMCVAQLYAGVAVLVCHDVIAGAITATGVTNLGTLYSNRTNVDTGLTIAGNKDLRWGICAEAWDSDNLRIFYVLSDTLSADFWDGSYIWQNTYTVGVAPAASVGAPVRRFTGAIPIAEPTPKGTTIFLPVLMRPRSDAVATTGAQDQRQYLLLDMTPTPPKVVARWLPGYGSDPGALLGANASVCSRLVSDSGTWRFGCPKVTRVTGKTEKNHAPVVVEISPDTVTRAIESDSQLLIPTSKPQVFDGDTVVEDGFNAYPDVDATLNAVPGDLSPGKLYGYKAVYVWTDAQGKRHVSAESKSSSFSTATNQERGSIKYSFLPATDKDDVTIELYRTKGDGSIYYLLTDPIANNVLAEDASFPDNTLDSALRDEYIYTTGGVLNNTQVPPYRVSCMHHERRFIVPRHAEATEIQYSKLQAPDDPVNHSGILSIHVPPEGGRIYALASYSNQLIAFKKDRILVYFFTERDNTGKGANARAPRVLLGKGTTNAKSVIETPSGLMFDAGNGIYALSNKGVVSFIGEPVQYWTDTETIVRGMLVPDRDMAVFLTGGNALAYNYRYNLWSTFSGFAAADGVQVGNLMYFITTPGVPWRENRATYADNEQAYNFRVRTPWYSFSGIGGLARLYRALLSMYNVGDHKLKLKTAYDMVPLFVDDQEFDAEAFSGQFAYLEYYGAMGNATLADKAYTIEGDVSQQKVTSVMFEISDEPPDGGNLRNSFSLVSMSLMVGAKRGLFRQGDARRIGD